MSGLLHRQVWRNDIQGVASALEEQPSCVNEVDDESGWTPLHVALYYGNLRVAARLLQKHAQLEATDLEDRTPLELISKELPSMENTRADVFSWGSGANYQLGTGHTGLQTQPRRLETLAHTTVVEVAASKFHSMAVTADGQVYTWGWGLGGRLGHPEGKLHSENGAEIFPRVVRRLGQRRIVSVAAAKHHSLAVTETGEVFSWGLSRDGRLGYATGASKQVVPKRIDALKGVSVIQASAANKHSAVISQTGMICTWGSNVHGQLGYGTSDSGSNPGPRCVEGLKHKFVTQVSLAKRHSLALTKEGDVYSWGHKCVAPKRILLQGSRDQQGINCKGDLIHFHRGLRKVRKPIAVMIAAGVHESYCLTTTGAVICWKSAQPSDGNVREVGGKLSGKTVTFISAGKTVTSAVTKDGRVYSWTVSSCQHLPKPELIPGMRNTASVAVGERHIVALQRWIPAHVALSPGLSETGSESALTHPSTYVSAASEADLGDESNAFKCLSLVKNKKETKSVTGDTPSLQSLCERAVAQHHLNPRTVLQFLCYADATGSDLLKSCCLHLAVHNLTLVFQESHASLVNVPDELLLELEQFYQEKMLLMTASANSDCWWDGEQSVDNRISSITRRPTRYTFTKSDPSALVIHSPDSLSSEKNVPTPLASANRFLPDRRSSEKLLCNMRQKLKQIAFLEQRMAAGDVLDTGQRAKIARRGMYERALDALENGVAYEDVQKTLAETQPAAVPVKPSKPPPVKDPKTPMATKQPSTSPSLWPVLSVPPRRRDVGPMPRFLEPSRTKKKPLVPPPPPEQYPSVLSSAEKRDKEKRWLKLELHSEPKTRGSVVTKAQPSKEVRKMSLSDFMVASEETLTEPQAEPVKESTPAWGGLRFDDQQPSFRSIQEEQQNHRPGMRSAWGTKPVVETRRTVSRWQMHVDVQVQSINSIQIEERAVQELSALYKGATVKVKPGTARTRKEIAPER